MSAARRRGPYEVVIDRASRRVMEAIADSDPVCGGGPDACGGCHGRMGRPDPLHFDVHHAADDAALAAVLAEFPEAAS